MTKSLWLIWKEPSTRRRYIIGELSYNNETYKFNYISPELNDARKNGFKFFPGFDDVSKEYVSEENLFPNIDSRLPNKGRPEYLDILNVYNLDINSSKMEILERTKGRLLTDNYEFVPVFDKNKIEFEIAGTRHSKDIQKYKDEFEVNDSLTLEREYKNKYDEYAVKVMCKKRGDTYNLGYVPRYYSKELSKLLEKNIKYSAKIKYLNFETDINDENITADVKIILANG